MCTPLLARAAFPNWVPSTVVRTRGGPGPYGSGEGKQFAKDFVQENKEKRVSIVKEREDGALVHVYDDMLDVRDRVYGEEGERLDAKDEKKGWLGFVTAKEGGQLGLFCCMEISVFVF